MWSARLPNNMIPFSCLLASYGFMHLLRFTYPPGRPAWVFNFEAPLIMVSNVIGMGLLASSVLLLANPSSFRWFSAVVWLIFIHSIAVMPETSHNHITGLFAVMAMVAGYIALWGRHRSFTIDGQELYEVFAPASRCVLLVLYFFGIFHKINTGFLDPSTSCAVELWYQVSFLPTWMKYSEFWHQVAIYGTFVVEGLAMVMLCIPRLRFYGILCGVLFHTFLGLNHYALYISYSMICISLHFLNLPPDSYQRFKQSRIGAWVTQPHIYPSIVALLCVYVGMVMVARHDLSRFDVRPLWAPYALLVVLYIVFFGKSRQPNLGWRLEAYYLRSKVVWVNIVPILFFLNNSMAYIGLKTSQDISMFGNLRTEGGQTNHLLFDKPPYLFDYQNDLVTFPGSKRSTLAWTYYKLLDSVDRNPDTVISFERNGVQYNNWGYADFEKDIKNILHPRWFRGFFHFKVTVTTDPVNCRNGS